MVAAWSANFVVVKAAIAAVGALQFTGARWSLAAVTLLALVHLRDGTLRPPRGHRLELFVLGAIGFALYQVLWTLGLGQVPAGDSALLVAAAPVLTAVLAGAAGIDRLTAPRLAGAVVALAGVALVVGATLPGADAPLGGYLLTLGAAASWAVYAVGGARVLRSLDPLTATAWSVAAGAVCLAPLGLGAAILAPGGPPTLGVAGAVLFSGVVAAALANVLVFRAMHRLGPTRVTQFQSLVPFGAVLLGAALLAEAVRPSQLAGGAVIVAGVWLTRRETLRRRPAAA